MEQKSQNLQLALPNSASIFFTNKDNKDGCIQERMGSSLLGNSNRRRIDFTGTTTSYKFVGNKGSKNSFPSISQAASHES